MYVEPARSPTFKRPGIQCSGHWLQFSFPKHILSPPSELEEFLKSGNAPICVSFGCMVGKHAERVD